MYREFRPDPKLRPFVECGWLRSGSATPSIRVMPDGCVDVFVTADGEVMVAGPANVAAGKLWASMRTATRLRSMLSAV